MFERIFFIARQKFKLGPFLDSADLMNPVGCNREQLKDILVYCGFSYLKLSNERILTPIQKLNVFKFRIFLLIFVIIGNNWVFSFQEL